MAYVLPQVQVFQEFRALPGAVIKNLNAFVFGPQYQPFRFGEPSEKALIGLGAYDKDNDTIYNYPNQPAGSTVDTDFVKLFIENVEAEYIEILADDANPINMVSQNPGRNKLRAAPVIGVAEEGVSTDSVVIDNSTGIGWFIGGVDLPENYYFHPTGGADGSGDFDATEGVSDLSGTGEGARLLYQTTEGLSGQVDITKGSSPLAAGNFVEGPDGLQFDLDAGTDDLLHSPRINTVTGASGSTFDISVDTNKIKSIIDDLIDNSLTLKANFAADAGSGVGFSVSFVVATRTLTVVIDTVLSPLTTVTTFHDALEADSDISTFFDTSAITGGDGTDAVTTIVDQEAVDVFTGVDFVQLEDGYRIQISANPFNFSTGNGFNHSAQFKSRGVKVGDVVRFEVIDDALVTHTGQTKVVGFEADQTLARVKATTFHEDNAATQTGTDLTPKIGTNLVVAGPDNQRAMDGTETRVYALHPTWEKYTGDFPKGIISENITITVKSPGPAGTALADVSYASGTYSRTNVLIEVVLGVADAGRIYVGNNVWVLLNKGAGDADAEFQTGDSYSFSPNIEAPFTALGSNDVTSGGTYSGPSDTTYVVEVTRGGVFDRIVRRIDGLNNPSQFVVDYSGAGGNVVDTDAIEVGGQSFEFESGGGVSAGAVAVTIGATIDDSFDNLAAAITAQTTLEAYASNNTTTDVMTIHAPSQLLAAPNASESIADAGITSDIDAALLTTTVDFDDWTGGEVNDEYFLRCKSAGTITTALWELSSQLGDNQGTVQFTGLGSANTITLGGKGLKAFMVEEGTPSYTVGDYFIIKVFAARPQVKITDTAGVDQSTFEIVDNDIAVNLGLFGGTITYAANVNTAAGFTPNGGLLKGNIYFVEATAAADGALRTLILADDLPEEVTSGLSNSTNPDPNNFQINLSLVQTSTQINRKRLESPPDVNFVVTVDDFTAKAGITVQDPSFSETDGSLPFLPVQAGNLFLEYRALLSDNTDTIRSISDIGDVISTLGVIDVVNPLAQGVFNALSNSGNRAIFYMATPTDDLAGYLSVLDRASLSDETYGFAPLTQDKQILNAVEAHVNAQSTETEKHWRIAFVGNVLPDEEIIFAKSTHTSTIDFLAKVLDDPDTVGTQFTRVEFVDPSGNPDTGNVDVLDDVKVGDKLRINFATDPFGDPTFEEFIVAELLTSTTLLLQSGPAAAITIGSKVEVIHPRSTQEIAEAVKADAESFANRRVYYVFPSTLGAFGALQSSEFGAAAVAGLSSSVAPQQGLTNIELNGFDDLPLVYSTFSRDQLNLMAEGGALIIMQEIAGGRIFIRHQVSTASFEDDVKTRELSVTKNLDSISFFFAAKLQPFIGRFNITPELLTVLRTNVEDGLFFLGSFTEVGLLGPQILLQGTQITALTEHPVLKDHVIINVDVQLPLPLNVIELHLVV